MNLKLTIFLGQEKYLTHNKYTIKTKKLITINK